MSSKIFFSTNNTNLKIKKNFKKFNFEIKPIYYSNFIIFYHIDVSFGSVNNYSIFKNVLYDNYNNTNNETSKLYNFFFTFFLLFLIYTMISFFSDLWIQNLLFSVNTVNNNKILSYFFKLIIETTFLPFSYNDVFFISAMSDYSSFYKIIF